MLHVAGGANDALGAKAAGVACAWLNRRNDIVIDPSCSAAWEMADLRGVLEIL